MDKCPKCGEKDYYIIENGFYKCKKCGNIWKCENINKKNPKINYNMIINECCNNDNNYNNNYENYIHNFNNNNNLNNYDNIFNNSNNNKCYNNDSNYSNRCSNCNFIEEIKDIDSMNRMDRMIDINLANSINNMNNMNNMNNNMNKMNNNMNNMNNINEIPNKIDNLNLSGDYLAISRETSIKAEEKENFLINIKFFELDKNVNYEKKNLTGLLNLCLMKYISELIEEKIILDKLSPEIKAIILKLHNSLEFTKDNKKNIYNLLQETKGNNIIIYSQYINMIINTTIINNIINLLKNEKKDKINNYWKCLSKYQAYNSFFEKELIKDLKNTKFDYSLIGLGILEKKEEEQYKIRRDSCPNMEKRILYHGSKIDPISNILTTEFKYSTRPFYGMGIYFSDIIDYVSFYRGGKDSDGGRINFGDIVPVNDTFSFIACEVFYDKKKFKQIKDDSLYVPDIDHFPTYEELKEKYSDKMVEPNGIHFIRVNNEGDSLSESCFLKERKKGEFLGNEYAITEKYQILPIYSLTIKRNEYFILWRDPNFKGKNEYSDYLLERKLYCIEKAKMNIYFESSTEEALKFLQRRKYNKVILITSVGLDLSGKKFIEIARKIFGFDLMVLFFSANQDHLKWIKSFPNCLYTDAAEIYEEYISNFNEQGLKNLKKVVEKEYNICLKEFSDDFLSYPNFKNEAEYSELNFSNINPYIRHVRIYCKNKNLYLYINESDQSENNIWDITIIEDEITLYLNGNYIDVDEDNETITGSPYMKIWKFNKTKDGQYYFIFPKKKYNNILSIEKNVLKVDKDRPGKNELFQLIDEIEN